MASSFSFTLYIGLHIMESMLSLNMFSAVAVHVATMSGALEHRTNC